MPAPPPPPPQIPPIVHVATAREEVASACDRLAATMGRASALAEDVLHEGVNGEWSTVESLRHLVLVIDLWLSRTILGDPDPFHPMALPPSFMPPKLFPGSSIDPSADPSFSEASDVLRERLGRLQAYVDEVEPAELTRPVQAHVGTVGGALGVMFHELSAHDGFINRDLEGRGA
jgi:hypothetical protein